MQGLGWWAPAAGTRSCPSPPPQCPQTGASATEQASICQGGWCGGGLRAWATALPPIGASPQTPATTGDLAGRVGQVGGGGGRQEAILLSFGCWSPCGRALGPKTSTPVLCHQDLTRASCKDCGLVSGHFTFAPHPAHVQGSQASEHQG